MDAIEAVSVSIAVNIGTENNAKYAMCSANGWMTAEKTKTKLSFIMINSIMI